MKIHSSLLTYPVFRLTVFLAAGIFLSDRLLSGLIPWECLFLGFLIFSVLSGCFFRSSLFRFRHLFGCMVSVAFFFLGGALSLHEREQVEFEWNPRAQVYWGMVEDIPRQRGKTVQAKVSVSYMREISDSLSGSEIRKEWVGRSVLLSWIPDSLSGGIQCGDSVCFYAKLSRPASTKEITGFDYGNYLMRQGISGTGIAFSGNWMCVKKNELSFRQYALTIQQRIVRLYHEWGLDGDVLAVVSALTVGDRSDLTPELEAVYSATGASHVLSLSGLHIGILAGILFLVFRPLRGLRYGSLFSTFLIVGFLWVFAFISGMSSPVIRSVVMFSLYMISALVSKDRFSGVYSVTLTAFMMLLYNPFYLFDISFQLSFVAVYSILLFYPLFSRLWVAPNRFCRYVWNTLALSMAAQLGTFPLVLLYFGAFPTYFLLANLIVAPLSACILGGAMSALALFSVPVLGDCAVWFLRFSTNLLNDSMRMVQQLYGSQLTSLYLSEVQLVILFLLLGLVYGAWAGSGLKYARTPIRILAVSVVFLAVCWYERAKPSPCHLCFFRSEVYARQGRTLSLLCSSDGLFRIDSLKVGVMKSGRWRDKMSETRLPLDFVYICRGFKGNLAALNRLFVIREVVLDSSLSDNYRESLIRECRLLKISYTDLSVSGSCLILL